MSNTTEKAGNLLPQNEPQLAKFIKAQNHIRAAARLIDDIRVAPNPKFGQSQKDSFRNLAAEIRDTLWECDSDTEDLLFTQFSLEFPVDNNQ